MSSNPTPLSQFLPLDSFFMRLPSSSSLLLASLAVSSSSSSLSALAAPAGDGQESLSSPIPVPPPPPVSPVPPHASIPHGGDDKMAQPNGYLQTRNLVDKVTAPLPVPPEIVKAIPDLVDAILKPLIGKDAPKAREEPLDAVKHLVPGKTLRADGAVEAGANETSENSPSQGEATTPVAGSQDVPVAAPNPPAGCPSQPSPAATYGESGANLDPSPPAESPSPPAQSGSGGDVGGNPGANVGVSSSGDAGVSAGANAGCSG